MSKTKEAEVTAPVAKEPEYSASEFVHAAKKLFGTTPDIVAAALKAKNKSTATISEAKKIVDAFRNKEVK